MVEKEDDMASAIQLNMKKQEEHIQKSGEALKDTQTNLQRAGELIKYFAKGIYTDKIMRCLICLCILAIIIIIALKIFKKTNITIPTDIVKSS